MEVSEARLTANRANAARSTGPKTTEGKAASRRNSFKHGMTGRGIVLPEGDQAEVESRFDSLRDELKPQSSVGTMLIRKLATLSVRSERAAERENAAIAERVRGAVDAFDEARGQRVDDLFGSLSDNPRGALRNLRRMPEGVDRLLETWRDLRHELDQDRWGAAQLARAATLTGERTEVIHGLRIGELSRAIWGEFQGLAPHEGGGLDDEARREWARGALGERIDGTIAELEAHRETLDLDRIEQDRREAPVRATFDDSREAALARRYEADADRSFYKALKEFRQVEAEAEARLEAGSERPRPAPGDTRMGSSRASGPPPDRERLLASPAAPPAGNPPVRGSKGRPSTPNQPVPPRL